MKLTIGHLYPDLLNLYGDRGNIQCFAKRLQWRGIDADIVSCPSGSRIDFDIVGRRLRQRTGDRLPISEGGTEGF